MLATGWLAFYYLGYVPWVEARFLEKAEIQTLEQTLPVRSIAHFLSPAEMARLQRLSAGRMGRSRVYSAAGSETADYRTSSTATLPYFFSCHPMLHHIRCRAALLCGLSFRQVEALQVCRYRPGEAFGLHYDYFEVEKTRPVAAGNRIATVLVYLNRVESGGQTHFPQLNLSLAPQQATAVYWRNLTSEGQKDPRTLHEGMAVAGSEDKWIMNIWIREKPMILGFIGHYFLRILRLR